MLTCMEPVLAIVAEGGMPCGQSGWGGKRGTQFIWRRQINNPCRYMIWGGTPTPRAKPVSLENHEPLQSPFTGGYFYEAVYC